MRTKKSLKDWKKNFITIPLKDCLFNDNGDELIKVVEILKLFSPNKVKCQFNTEEKDKFLDEIISAVNCKMETLHKGKNYLAESHIV